MGCMTSETIDSRTDFRLRSDQKPIQLRVIVRVEVSENADAFMPSLRATPSSFRSTPIIRVALEGALAVHHRARVLAESFAQGRVGVEKIAQRSEERRVGREWRSWWARSASEES